MKKRNGIKRVVLGEGYPCEYDDGVSLHKKNNCNDIEAPTIFCGLGNLHGKKIRLIAEVLE